MSLCRPFAATFRTVHGAHRITRNITLSITFNRGLRIRSSSSTSTSNDSVAGNVSSCPKGTTLKGLNILNGKSDPIAMADEEYPEWLWKLLDPAPEPSEYSLKKLRKQSKQKILFNSMNKGRL